MLRPLRHSGRTSSTLPAGGAAVEAGVHQAEEMVAVVRRYWTSFGTSTAG